MSNTQEEPVTIAPSRADAVARRLERVARGVEPALEPDEIEAIDEAVAVIDALAGIERGERIARSPMTGVAYRVTRWVGVEGDSMVALEKAELESADDATIADCDAGEWPDDVGIPDGLRDGEGNDVE